MGSHKQANQGSGDKAPELRDSAPAYEYPKLRALDPKWIEHEGRELLFLRDPLSMSDDNVLVPAPLVPLLTLCDGSKDLKSLRAGFALRTGIEINDQKLFGLFKRLDSALLLDNSSFRLAHDEALNRFRCAPQRPMSHSGAVYPEDAVETRQMILDFCESAPMVGAGLGMGRLVGMLSPHIDFARGGRTYAETWQTATGDLSGIECVILLGTDHMGGPAALTLTQQNYATPFGTLPTDIDVIDRLAGALGGEPAYAEELHHRSEHSIELAAVWMHCFLESKPPAMVPVLCGSFGEFVSGRGDPRNHVELESAIDVLAEAVSLRRTLVIAAGDLAHVGPVFGDASPVAGAVRHSLQLHDEESLAAICEGDAERFLELSVTESDKRRICGLSPIYLMLEILRRAYGRPAKGVSMGYDQCPADDSGGSLVSIAGAVLYA